MIQDWFCDIYSSIKDKNTFLKRIRFYSLLRWLTRQTANIILPLAFRLYPSKNQLSDQRSPRLIVSLTTFPARIEKLWLVIECLFRQAVLPDKIILWLSQEQFASIQSLPAQLLKYQKKGLDIRLVEGDIRSHKKYAYAFKQYPEDIIITIDDDVFYPSYMIQSLCASHGQYPHDTIANVAHQICYTPQGEVLPYNEWKHNTTQSHCSEHIFQVGVGGVLYPPHCTIKEVIDTRLAFSTCPCGDDIWLYAMCRLKGTMIRTSDSPFFPLPIINRYNKELSTDNLANGNDIQIRQLMNYSLTTWGRNPFEQNR